VATKPDDKDKEARRRATAKLRELSTALTQALSGSADGVVSPSTVESATRIASEMQQIMEEQGITGSNPFNKITAAVRMGRQVQLEQLRDITTDRSLPPSVRSQNLQSLRQENISLSREMVTNLSKFGTSGEQIASEFERVRTRQLRDIESADRTVGQQERTQFRQDIELQSSPTAVDDSGNVKVRSVSERLATLNPQESRLRDLLKTEVSSDKQNLVKQQLSDLYAKRRQLQISETREAAIGVSEQTQFVPTEVSPGMWRAPALSSQRNAAQTALKEAQQLKASLGADALPEQQKQANELLKKMVDQLSSIDKNILQGQQELAKAKVQAPLLSAMMKRKEGEEDSEYASRISQRAALVKGVGGAALGTASVIAQTVAAIKGMTFDMPGRTLGLASSTEGGLQGQFLDALSFSAQSRARFGGDILFKDPTLGRSGHDIAARMSMAEMDRRRSAEGWSLGGQGMQALVGAGQLVAGAGAIAMGGLTGVGAPIGLMAGSSLIAGGVSSLTGALSGSAQNTRAQESGALDFAGPFSTYAGAMRQAQIQQTRDMLVNQAMERNKVSIASQEAYESGLGAYAQNIRSAGAWAVDPEELVSKTKTQTWGRLEGGVANEMAKLTGATTPGQTKADMVASADMQRRKDQEAIQEQAIANLDLFSSRYGMSVEEWSSKVGTVSSRMGVGVGKTTNLQRQQAAQRLYEMGLTGLGSFEQISANAETMANLTGRTDSSLDLEKIMSKAVKTGFDDSRTGQSFIQSSMSIANALGVRGDVSDALSFGTRIAGGTEKDMEATARGMVGLPQVFERSKMLGGLNFASFLASGGLNQDAVTAQDAFDISKNPHQYLKVQSDITNIRLAMKGMTGKDEREKIVDLLDSQEFKNIDPAVRDVLYRHGTKGLDQFAESAGSGIKSFGAIAGIDKRAEKVREVLSDRISDKQKRFELNKVMRDPEALEIFAKIGLGPEERGAAYQAAMIDALDPKDRERFEKLMPGGGDYDAQKAEAAKKAESAAIIRRNAVAAQAALLTQGRTQGAGKLTKDEIEAGSVDGKFRFATQSGRAMEISSERAKEITQGGEAKGSAETEFKKWASETSKLQASLQSQMFTSLESVLSGKTQQVWVMNWEGMVTAQKTVAELSAPGGTNTTTTTLGK
jgi:hypothetical protein